MRKNKQRLSITPMTRKTLPCTHCVMMLTQLLYLLFLIQFINAEQYGIIKSCPQELLDEKYPIMKEFLREGDYGVSQYSNIDVIYGKRYKKVTLSIYIGKKGSNGRALDTILLSNYKSQHDIAKTLSARGFHAHDPPKQSEVVKDEMEKMQAAMDKVLGKGDDGDGGNGGDGGDGGDGTVDEKEVENLIMVMNKVKMGKEKKFDPTTLTPDSIMEGL